MKRYFGHTSAPRGVALLMVLTVLTVLSILSATFATFIGLESQSGAISVGQTQSDMLAQSALQHAYGLLREDYYNSSAYDDYSESWAQTFKPKKGDQAVDMDGTHGDKTHMSRWIYVRDANDRIIGRYAVMVEDELAKINVNTATALSKKEQNEGFGTFEVMLTGENGKAGLPISPEAGKNILMYRYGRDQKPGQANVDDNLNASQYSSDEIDNNANLLVDERDEGVDEPEEYNPDHLVWDDKAFLNMREVISLIAPNKQNLSLSLENAIKHYATITSRSQESYFDETSGKVFRQLNINNSDMKQLRRVMRNANLEYNFENSSTALRDLVVNMADYTDENHVLSTIESTYGIEAVCFNEIMAHDGSWIVETDHQGYGRKDENSYHVMFANRIYSGNWDYDRTEFISGSMRTYWRIKDVRTSGNRAEIKLDNPMYTSGDYNTFMKAEVDGWLKDQWKNATCIIHHVTGQRSAVSKGFEIEGNSAGNSKSITIRVSGGLESFLDGVKTNTANDRISIWSHWMCSAAVWTDRKEQTGLFYTRPNTPKQEKFYYLIYSANQAFKNNWCGFKRSDLREMDMDGIPSKYSVTQEDKDKRGNYLLRYKYKDGKPQKPNHNGFLSLYLTSSRRCKKSGANQSGKNVNSSDALYFFRPDIVELINISSAPISLRNWSVVVNTGVESFDLARIDKAEHYSKAYGGYYDDPNPLIAPGGYFYLTSNKQIFDIEYCKGTGGYGHNKENEIPVFELPADDWGILYDVTKVSGYNYGHSYITVTGADWKKDQLKGEIIEFVSTRHPRGGYDAPNGMFKYVYNNTSHVIDIGVGDAVNSGLEAGDQIRVRGLPRQGGFVSFTLKNEYGQIAARTTEYGSLTKDEIGYSTEKSDPAHYIWHSVSAPTFGGTADKAKSRAFRKHSLTHIKNNHLANVGEVLNVRTADSWSTVGTKGRGGVKTLKALSKYFTTSGIRLDSEEEGVHQSGWKAAFGEVIHANGDNISVKEAAWSPNAWTGQTMRVLSGPFKGEKIPIKSNTGSGVLVEGLSAPNEKQLRLKKGDLISVGPGYATAMYYTDKEGDEGIWEWQNKGLLKSDYGLYIFGLNDSIKTTEFLEENHNATIEVYAYNFAKGEYDRLPLPDDRMRITSDNPYLMGSQTQRLQLDKNDRVYCGLIHAAHISPHGGIRLKIIPNNLRGQETSGKAWFDYAFLAPGQTSGKININTATPRVLSALKGVTPAIAAAIEKGIDRSGNKIKPYRNTADILDIQGMTPSIFSEISNLITVRSDQYRIKVIADSVEKVTNDPQFNEEKGDKVIARSIMDVIVDRSDLAQSAEDNGKAQFRVISKE